MIRRVNACSPEWDKFLEAYTATKTRSAVDMFLAGLSHLGDQPIQAKS